MLSREMFICIAAVAGAILVVIFVIGLYNAKEKDLYEEIQELKDEWAAEEKERRSKLRQEENESKYRIQREREILENERQNFERQVEVFNKEQNVRSELQNKSERELAVETHVKLMHINEALNQLTEVVENSINEIKNIESLADNLSYSFSDFEEALDNTVSGLREELEENLDGIECRLTQSIENNSSSDSGIDSDNLKQIVSDALDNNYMFSYNLESTIDNSVSSAVESEISGLDSKLNDLDSKLNDIESKLNDIEWKIES